ncbi:MAG: DUF2617 family protein, partial [Thermomicrobiales bacterium]
WAQSQSSALPDCPPARLPDSPLRYVAQSVADLRYLLCPAPLDPARWQALDQARLTLPWGSLELTIIGASHVLVLSAGGQQVTEVLACLPPVPLPAPAIVERPAAGRWRISVRCGPVRYTTRFALRRYSAASKFALAQAAIVACRPALLRLFPAGPAAVAPLTAIAWRVAGARVHLATHHTYPLERAIVVTETAIVPGARGERHTADGPSCGEAASYRDRPVD